MDHESNKDEKLLRVSIREAANPGELQEDNTIVYERLSCNPVSFSESELGWGLVSLHTPSMSELPMHLSNACLGCNPNITLAILLALHQRKLWGKILPLIQSTCRPMLLNIASMDLLICSLVASYSQERITSDGTLLLCSMYV